MFEGFAESQYARDLRARAGEYPELVSLSEISPPALAGLARRFGCDFATALLFDRICKSTQHGDFIQSINHTRLNPCKAEKLRIVIVPGAFHKEYRHTGADGARLIAPLKNCGFDVTVMPIPSFAPLQQGAANVSEWISANVDSPTLLMSLSKGSAEVKLALAKEQTRTWSRWIVGWIDVSGILEGTALVNWLERRHWRWWAIRAGLWARGQSIGTLKQLERMEHSTLGEPTTVPEGLTTIHVVGFPLVEHLSNRWAQRGHRRLAPLGPNDGGGILLADTLLRPGLLFPAWGADHYLNPVWKIEDLIVRLISFVQNRLER